MKTLKVLLQEVVSGIKAWVNSNFAQESNAVHKTGNETVNGIKTFTGTNTYSSGSVRIKSLSQEIGAVPNSDITQYLEFKDKSDAQHGVLGLWDNADGSSYLQLYISDKFKNGVKDSTGTLERASLLFGFKPNGDKTFTFSGQIGNHVIPTTNNTYNLGDNSYQWNNVYAKSYYYNGTAWGLDKSNTWTQANTFKTTVTYEGNFACYWKRPNLTVGTLPSSVIYYGATRYADSAGTTITLTRGLVDTSGKNCFRLYTYAFNNTSKFCSMGSGIDADGSNSYFAFNAESVFPNDNNVTDLGTSTYKWKSFNGINPGALSFPGARITLDTTGWDDTGTSFNEYTPTADGWILLTSKDVVGNFLFVAWKDDTPRAYAIGTGTFSNLSAGLIAMIPVIKNKTIQCLIKSSNYNVRFFPCLGNV